MKEIWKKEIFFASTLYIVSPERWKIKYVFEKLYVEGGEDVAALDPR